MGCILFLPHVRPRITPKYGEKTEHLSLQFFMKLIAID